MNQSNLRNTTKSRDAKNKMYRKILKVIIIFALFLFLGLVVFVGGRVGYFKYFYLKGMLEAKSNISNDQYIIKTFGLGAPSGEYKYQDKIFKMIPVAGCVVSIQLEEYVDGYNKVSENAIEDILGESLWDWIKKSRLKMVRVEDSLDSELK